MLPIDENFENFQDPNPLEPLFLSLFRRRTAFGVKEGNSEDVDVGSERLIVEVGMLRVVGRNLISNLNVNLDANRVEPCFNLAVPYPVSIL